MSEDLKRADDQLIGKLIQALDDDRQAAREWRDRHDQESREWRETIDLRLKPIEEWVHGANAFWKILAAVSGLGVGAVKLWTWFSGHWK